LFAYDQMQEAGDEGSPWTWHESVGFAESVLGIASAVQRGRSIAARTIDARTWLSGQRHESPDLKRPGRKCSPVRIPAYLASVSLRLQWRLVIQDFFGARHVAKLSDWQILWQTDNSSQLGVHPRCLLPQSNDFSVFLQ
jgi:hypothetical protein